MHPYQREFIEFAIQHKALKFGDFTLKSGRKSPYFFNIGVFNDGNALSQLGKYYASAIINSNLSFDLLFGPAYKGIPLVCTAAISLANDFHRNMHYCFNRKEMKDHGEGGNIIGAPLAGNILLIDDVITAGTAIGESMQLIEKANAKLAGVIIAFNRQERGQTNKLTIDEVEEKYKTKVISIINLDNILEYLSEKKEMELLKKVGEYRRVYG